MKKNDEMAQIMNTWEKELTAQRRSATIKVVALLAGLALYLVIMFSTIVQIPTLVRSLMGLE